MGVDYGAKLAGTTAAAMVVAGSLQVRQSPRGQDADVWLQHLIREWQPAVVYLDAPLTLPKVYSLPHYLPDADFFYREADREVQAMSPMFLGGLTARAIRLRTQLAARGVAVLETYPSQLAMLLFPELHGYKKDLAKLPAFTGALQGQLIHELKESPQSWHQFDALLAWLSGYRHSQGQSLLYGDPREGRIIV